MTDAERYAAIADIKRGAEFALRGEDLSVVGSLRAITERDLGDSALIAAMAEARTRNGRYFMSRFDVSPENKREWLADCVLPSKDRVIFFVQTAVGDIVGQDGFTYLGGGVFELDGTMRWASGGPRGLYVRSGIERAGICFGMLGADKVITEVLSDNIANMKNSSRMGFDLVCEDALFLSEERGVLRYERADAASANTDRRLALFEMTRVLFAERNPEIASSHKIADVTRVGGRRLRVSVLLAIRHHHVQTMVAVSLHRRYRAFQSHRLARFYDRHGSSPQKTNGRHM